MPTFLSLSGITAGDTTELLAHNGTAPQGVVSIGDIKSIILTAAALLYASIDYEAIVDDLLDDFDAHVADEDLHGGGGGRMVGEIAIWMSSTIPSGWYHCNGQAIDETSDLGVFLLANGQTTNGDGTVDVYDLQDYFLVGAGNTYSLRESGGEAEVTLSVDEMPAHDHDVYRTMLCATGSARATSSVSEVASSGKTSSEGGGEAHNNLPPYVAPNYIIYGG